MKQTLIFLCVLLTPHALWANVVSAEYVQQTVSTKVDVSENASQTMAGSYTVSGTLLVPTPPLPTAE